MQISAIYYGDLQQIFSNHFNIFYLSNLSSKSYTTEMPEITPIGRGKSSTGFLGKLIRHQQYNITKISENLTKCKKKFKSMTNPFFTFKMCFALWRNQYYSIFYKRQTQKCVILLQLVMLMSHNHHQLSKLSAVYVGIMQHQMWPF